HLARQTAHFLYGDEDRLVRFDMNEFTGAEAVARLVGTAWEPEGLLTAAVRRQPFCVLLLDEIEKAHADVFNLLLQVMGDGRLTDALGRTVDFSQVLLVMTSNLGAAEVARPLGLRTREADAEALTYRKAAERFFAPEFFNRLDAVVPFRRLGLAEVEHVCRQVVEGVFRREGLTRRQCILDVDPQVVRRLAEGAHDPELGARALKRAIERDLVDPIAERLAVMPAGSPAVVFVRGDGAGLSATVHGIERPSAATDLFDLVSTVARPRLLEAAGRVLERVDRSLSRDNDRYDPDALDAEAYRHLARKEQGRRLRAWRDHQAESPGRAKTGGRRQKRLRSPLLFDRGWQSVVSEKDFAGSLPRLEPVEEWDRIASLLGELAWLDLSNDDRIELAVDDAWLSSLYQSLAGDLLEVSPGLEASGPGAALLAGEAGIHLFVAPDKRLRVVRVGQGTRLVRVYDQASVTLDLTSGWMVSGLPGPLEFRALLLTRLPLPDEVYQCL
ncbi:MAG TPA: AAA family ATPase, partial [Candidatus Xenobia bacterium]